MTLFLLTFFLLYGSLHLYAFLRAKSAFSFSTLTGILVSVFMLIMIAAPVIVRVSEQAGLDLFARLMSYAGYMWMGILFLFVAFSLVIDLYRLIIYSVGLISGRDFSYLLIAKNHALFMALIVSLMISIYGYFEARNIRVETLSVRTQKIPPETGKIKIVQISDVHVGLIVRGERLRRILAEVKREDPDILISTGDLVDGQIDNLSGLAEMFHEIDARYGKYAITGNHEFYAGFEQAMNFTENSGFTILRGEGVTVKDLINIAGVDDRQAMTYGLFERKDERELLSNLPQEKFTLLLKHRPLVDQKAVGFFDLQLSGHVHRGQIFPFSIITGLYYETQAGFASLSNGSSLYVSRGSGTWGPPIRFLSPPEVTVIELIHSGTQAEAGRSNFHN